MLKTTLVRGHAFLSIKLHNTDIFATHISAKKETIGQYLTSIESIKKHFKIDGSITIQDILNLPHIFDVTENELESGVYDQVLQAVQQTAHIVYQDQEREGAHLASDLQKRCTFLQNTITELKSIADETRSERQEKLLEIRKNLEILDEQDPERDTLSAKKDMLLVEIEKTNITEEVVRFTTHLNAFMEALDQPSTSKGKRLDFITQELHREINTTSAKINNAHVSTLVVLIKSELEKIKEQIQNIV